jgi:hypothetical protein
MARERSDVLLAETTATRRSKPTQSAQPAGWHIRGSHMPPTHSPTRPVRGVSHDREYAPAHRQNLTRASRLNPFQRPYSSPAATLRAWREAGYRVSEQRVADWLYLSRPRQSRSPPSTGSLVPRFHGRAAVYEGIRVA